MYTNNYSYSLTSTHQNILDFNLALSPMNSVQFCIAGQKMKTSRNKSDLNEMNLHFKKRSRHTIADAAVRLAQHASFRLDLMLCALNELLG